LRSTCIEKDVVPKLRKKCSSEIETNNSSSLVGGKRLNTVEADMCSEHMYHLHIGQRPFTVGLQRARDGKGSMLSEARGKF